MGIWARESGVFDEITNEMKTIFTSSKNWNRSLSCETPNEVIEYVTCP